jgi:hypothetical protein
VHFVDLGTTTQIAEGDHVRAVGWLARSVTYPRGASGADFVVRVEEYARHWSESTEALGWPCAAGFHTCELCDAFHAAGNFGVPGRGVLYVCPEMIAHYVVAHEYLPPPEFVEALVAAPLPGTPAYALAVARFAQRVRNRYPKHAIR